MTMLIPFLGKVLTTTVIKKSNYLTIFWFSISLIFSANYSIQGLKKAFNSEYIISGDGRQHLFWMRRFLDPELFPHDLIANYFQSTAPLGYSTFYQLFASVGIDPVLLSKFLPIVLVLIGTGYCFGICLQIFPVPAAGFFATLMLNQNFWIDGTIASGTARAFLYPLFLAFLYYLLRRSLFPCLISIALQGLFYPPWLFVTAGVLALQPVGWEGGRLSFSRHRNDYWFSAAGLAVVFLVLLPFALRSSEFGPTITASQARMLPEFSSAGRTYFFLNNPLEFWLCGERSGILPWKWCNLPLPPPQIWLGLLLPIVLRYPFHFPLSQQVTRQAKLLIQIVLASLGLFFAAHAVLFKLYLPGRYPQHSLQIVMAIAAGIALIVILDTLFKWAEQPHPSHFRRRQSLALVSTIVLGIALVLYPNFLQFNNYPFPHTSYITGRVPALYKYFASQPKDIAIASLAAEADNLPTFAQRSVLVSAKFAVPYSTGYYAQIRQRAIDLINAQYSPDLEEVKRFIQKYGVDFWLLDRKAFTSEYIANPRSLTSSWIGQYQPAATKALDRLEQRIVPALARFMQRCSAFETESLVVLNTECIAKVSAK